MRGALIAVSGAGDCTAHRGDLELGPTKPGPGHGVAGLEAALPALREKPCSAVFLGQPFPQQETPCWS